MYVCVYCSSLHTYASYIRFIRARRSMTGVCTRHAAAASVAECVTFPVDATKTRLQLQGEVPPPSPGYCHRVRATWRLRSKNADGRRWLATRGACAPDVAACAPRGGCGSGRRCGEAARRRRHGCPHFANGGRAGPLPRPIAGCCAALHLHELPHQPVREFPSPLEHWYKLPSVCLPVYPSPSFKLSFVCRLAVCIHTYKLVHDVPVCVSLFCEPMA